MGAVELPQPSKRCGLQRTRQGQNRTKRLQFGYSVILVAPLLPLVRVRKILDNSSDYSIQSTTGQALFLPTSREAKYKAKAAIDAFFKRFGDVLQAGIFFFGNSLGVALFSLAALHLGF